jgi:peroxiredoxin
VDAVFELSTQDTPFQKGTKERLHLPYNLLSDQKLELVERMKMPVFE